MKIRGTQSPIPVDSARSRAVGPSPQPSSRTEKVRVSSEARSLMDARAPEEPDRARIERLTSAIREGRFEIDAERIADVMIAEEM